MLRVYGIKNCDSVKKALKFFRTHGIPHEFVDFRSTPVGCDTIDRWLRHADMKTLFNTRGTTYRTLGLKAMNLDDADRREWLCKENMLIKRPVVEKENNDVIIGFNEALYEGEFLS